MLGALCSFRGSVDSLRIVARAGIAELASDARAETRRRKHLRVGPEAHHPAIEIATSAATVMASTWPPSRVGLGVSHV
jgi:hypothetical protein